MKNNNENCLLKIKILNIAQYTVKPKLSSANIFQKTPRRNSLLIYWIFFSMEKYDFQSPEL